MEADSSRDVAGRLQAQGRIPVMIHPVKKTVGIDGLSGLFRKVSANELNMFTRQLFTLQKAGLPLLSSLGALERQVSSEFFKNVIRGVMADVESGSSFSAALARQPAVFNEIYRHMVEAGEATGRLDEALERAATLGEHEEEIRQRVKAALRYPMFVIFSLSAAFVTIITFVVPKFSGLYSKFATDLPVPTRILLSLHSIFVHYWWALLIGTGGLIYILRRIVKTPWGMRLWHRMVLGVPVMGPLVQEVAMTRFSRMTANLLKSGIPILQTLEIVSDGIGNRIVEEAIHDVQTGVNQGRHLAEPMEESGFFPPIVVQMVAVGEKSGRLPELLAHVADFYDGQIDYKIRNLVTLIEPILILILGLGVLLMALGIFLPLWTLMRLFH